MSFSIIVDSASDIELDEAQQMGVTLLPMEITFGDEIYRDGYDLTHREFFEKLIECSDIPKTSQISEYVFDEAIKKELEKSDAVIIIVMSRKLSGTCEQARKAAKKYDGKVKVLDSLNVAIGERILVEYAVRLRGEGKGLNETYNSLEEKKKKIRLLALLDTLKYLRKGGRISAIKCISGELLNIKPVISLHGGEIRVKMPGSRIPAFICRNNTETGQNARVHSIDDPLPVIDTRNRYSLIQPLFIPQQSAGTVKPVTEPVSTIATAGSIGIVRPFLIKYYSQGGAVPVDIPLHTVTTKDRFGIIRGRIFTAPDGRTYQLDITHRMLTAGELAAAMSFPRDYVFCGGDTAAKKQIGNAVPPVLAEALYRAVLAA